MMAPISTQGLGKAEAKSFCAEVHAKMSMRLEELNQEAKLLMADPQGKDSV
jgi:1-acyl-sn-glycerol-3-phosphate acyltransferase